MQGLIGASYAEIVTERARLATEGRGARLLALQSADGRWPLETRYPGMMPVEIDEGEGRPTLEEVDALRIWMIRSSYG